MEVTQDKVSFQKRFEEWHDKMDIIIKSVKTSAPGTQPETKFPSVVALSLMRDVASMIEMAYIAGANKVNITEGLRDIKDTGQTLVLAQNYVKDKGFR